MVSGDDIFVSVPGASDVTYREWHAFLNGAYSGLLDRPRVVEYRDELHWWRAGFILGSVPRYGAVVLLGVLVGVQIS